MFEIINHILSSPAGSFGFIFGILALGAWLIHYVTKKATIFNTKHNDISAKHQKHEDLFDEIRKDLSYIKSTVDIIKRDAEPLTRSHSPISLTEKGKIVSEDLDAINKVARNWERIKVALDSSVMNKNAYDIQQFCMEMAVVKPEMFFDEITLNEIKDYAFRQGNSIAYYAGIFGVIIRDRYLDCRGISIDEIDKHDPTPKTD